MYKSYLKITYTLTKEKRKKELGTSVDYARSHRIIIFHEHTTYVCNKSNKEISN